MSDSTFNKSRPETIVLGKSSFLRCECRHGTHGGERCEAEGVTYSVATGKRLWVCGVCMDNHPKAAEKFVSVRSAVMQGSRCVGRMVSKTMAKRTANALNHHKTNDEGV